MDKQSILDELIAEKKRLERALSQTHSDSPREMCRFEMEMLVRNIEFAMTADPEKQMMRPVRVFYFRD